LGLGEQWGFRRGLRSVDSSELEVAVVEMGERALGGGHAYESDTLWGLTHYLPCRRQAWHPYLRHRYCIAIPRY
jgi:hypothetical protein